MNLEIINDFNTGTSIEMLYKYTNTFRKRYI